MTIFHTSQFGKNTGQNLTKLYMDVNTNFVKYLRNFGLNLCIMDLRKNQESFKLGKVANPGAAQDLSKNFEFWTNFDLEYLSSCVELSLHTRVQCRTTSWEANLKLATEHPPCWIYAN